eukprot:TRINITY_DN3483_c0_g2_i1.p2 TRINITY_DN3483_c0_g2~~TRINITY_DN3483_c0_g2_i1.p2  ORF type:complete len:134 (+),score=19.38 TRINITY_DN3483_c0_g2_i1:793-1194(+)
MSVGDVAMLTPSVLAFAPKTTWPSDMNIHVHINQSLTAFDGTPLFKRDVSVYRIFKTSSLEMSLVDVRSEMAKQATGNTWDAFALPIRQHVPEVSQHTNACNTSSVSHSTNLSHWLRCRSLPMLESNCSFQCQ